MTPDQERVEEIRYRLPEALPGDGRVVFFPDLIEGIPLLLSLLDAERSRADEMTRLYERRGEALKRPCIQCGYTQNVIRPATPAPGGKEGV